MKWVIDYISHLCFIYCILKSLDYGYCISTIGCEATNQLPSSPKITHKARIIIAHPVLHIPQFRVLSSLRSMLITFLQVSCDTLQNGHNFWPLPSSPLLQCISEKAMATHCSVLAWRISGTAEPGGLPSMGSHRVGHDWSDLAAAVYFLPSKGRVFLHALYLE